ncbi:PREDICTED: peroxidase 13 isoform X2 [Tarenaya hassleriana]|uniref:peroxidase 13 isoform X2 n=1 Tax=Tarenaya hassleriana TaxID=28532 RepID=UPI00053C7C94|nr:PREDICTED: peroxidase 13 isoform X2 [Tarenaya hassleriana]
MKTKAGKMFVEIIDSRIFLILVLMGVSEAQLQVGFYSKTCPSAESTIRTVVRRAVAADAAAAARLLRLQFHDCFVEGCDASILIKHEPDERQAHGNQGVGGYEIIDEAKAELERACPGVVSCADIVALAARDAIVLTKGPPYEVPTGRRDGKVSSLELAANLPDVDDSINVLKTKFAGKGLSDKDLVLLSAGAHTIGTTACFFITSRLYNFSGGGGGGGADPALSPELLRNLKAKCPFGGDVNVRVPLDWGSESLFDDHILRNVKTGFGVIASDAVLIGDIGTRKIINSYLTRVPTRRANFPADFAGAMVKMGSIGVKTGVEGEIRRVCSATN